MSPPPIAQVDPETGEPIDGRPDLREWSMFEEYGYVTYLLVQFLLWIVSPICLLLTIFFDWLGFTGFAPFVDLNSGVVGYFLGMIDAWIPLHELIFQAFTLWGVMIMWTPFRVLIKYLAPGLG